MSNSEGNDGAPKRKWKKKKSLLATAKRYQKIEWWGRGANIPEDMYHYFVGLMEVMKNGISDYEEKCNFVNNVLEKTKDQEINLSSNQLGCRIIEELLPYSKPEDLERFIDVFSDELRTICVDKFASFVLQQLIAVCCDRGCENLNLDDDNEGEPASKKRKINEKKEYSVEHAKKCFDFAIKVSKYLLNNLEDFVWDVSANNIIRTDIKYLAGIDVSPCDKPKQSLFKKETSSDSTDSSEKSRQNLIYKSVPNEFKEIVEEYISRLSQWPQFADMPYDTITSGLLQILVYASGNINKKINKSLCKKLLNGSFAPDACMNVTSDEKEDIKDIKDVEQSDQAVKMPIMPPVFDSEPAVRLLEAVLKVSRSKIYTQIYAKCFINRLAILSAMPGLNFTVQRLFDNCTEKEEFEMMFDEISEKIDKILICGSTGVVTAIAKACLRLQCRQVKFIQAMENALGCSSTENHKYFVVLCARLLPLNRIDVHKLEEPYFVNIHGSVVLQTIFEFQRPKKVIDSLLAMTAKEIIVLLSDSKGCHISDSFYKGPFVGVKSKEYLTKRLKGKYQELAISKYGSRCLESMFYNSSIELRKIIMEELSNKSQLLNSTMFGQLIFTKLKVELFKKSFQSWKSAMDKENKTREIFKDIISDK